MRPVERSSPHVPCPRALSLVQMVECPANIRSNRSVSAVVCFFLGGGLSLSPVDAQRDFLASRTMGWASAVPEEDLRCVTALQDGTDGFHLLHVVTNKDSAADCADCDLQLQGCRPHKNMPAPESWPSNKQFPKRLEFWLSNKQIP